MQTAGLIRAGDLITVAGTQYRVQKIRPNEFGDRVMNLVMELDEIPFEVTMIIAPQTPAESWRDDLSADLAKTLGG